MNISAESQSSRILAGYAERWCITVRHLLPDPLSRGQTAVPAYQVPKPAVQKRMGNCPGRADALSGIRSANSEQAVHSFPSGVTTSAGEPGCVVRGRAPHHIPLLAQLLPAVAAGQPRTGVSKHPLAPPVRGTLFTIAARLFLLGDAANPGGALFRATGAFNCRGVRCRWMSPYFAHVSFKA